MKKFLSLLLIVFACVHPAYSQQLHVDSTRFITGYKPGTQINYAIPTIDKGILFVGYDINNPGGIIPNFPLDTVLYNVLIGNIDSNQKISWIKVYGGSQNDQAMSACQTPDGGYAVLATSSSADGDVSGFKGANDLWLLRIDNSGNLLWEKTYGGPAGDQATSIANTPDHGFILLGTSNGSGGDVPFHYGDGWTNDWILIKTDSSGNKEWCKDIGGTSDEQYYGSILAVDNSYYLIGSSASIDHDCIGDAWHSWTALNYDYHLLNLDAAGNVLWDSTYGGSADDIAVNALYDTKDSTIVITGSSMSLDYMVTNNHGNKDIWGVKVNKNGTMKWEKSLGSQNEEVGTGICETSNDGYIFYGNTHNGTIGLENLWLFILDNEGNEITNKTFGGIPKVVEISYSIVPYLGGYATTGLSGADAFTEGTTYGNFDHGGSFITYIDYWPLGVNNVPSSKGITITIYPNPTSLYVKINLPSQINEQGILTITNSIGQKFYEKQISQKEQSIDINTDSWAKGFYIVRWQGADGQLLTAKLVNN